MVYALADYKQLVIQYRTKHSELVKALAFWKTTCFWLMVLSAAGLVFGISMHNQNRLQARESRQDLAAMNNRLQSVTEQFESWQQELKLAREELDKKNEQVSRLERSLSTASKKQVEKLLKDTEAR